MSATLQEQIEAYLDGALRSRETVDFEATLSEPAVARALAEELLLRDFLQSMPPMEAPEGLVARIEEALALDEGAEPASSLSTTFRALRESMVWSMRGPVAGFSHGTPAPAGARAPSAADTLRYSLGLLPSVGGAPKAKRRPWWQRVLIRRLR